MASGNITTRTNLAAPQPTMLLYAGLSPFGTSDDRKITANALFQEITQNVTDLSLQFGDGVAAAVSAAGKGKLIYNDTTKTFQVSTDGGAYASLALASAIPSPGGVTNSVQINNGGGAFDGDAWFLYDTASHTVLIGSVSSVGKLKLRGTGVSNGVSFIVDNPASDLVYTLPNAAPTTNQVLQAAGVAGSNITLGWVTPSSGGTPGGSDTQIQYNNAGAFGGISGLTTNGSTTLTQTSNSATAFQSGPNGATNPVFQIVNNTASQADGLSVTGLAAGSGVTLTALSSGSNAPITLTPKGTGRVIIPTGSGSSPSIIPALAFLGSLNYGIGQNVASSAGILIFAGTEVARWVAAGIDVGTGAFQMGAVAGTPTVEFVYSAVNQTRLSNVSGGAGKLLIGSTTDAITAMVGNFTCVTTNAATNSVVDVARFALVSSGTPANGLGGILSFALESTTTDGRQAGALQWIWTDATDATRTARMAFFTTTSASSAERMSLDANGIRLPEISSAATPATNNIYLYSKDKSGASNLYFKNDAGTEFDLGVAGSGITGSGTNNFITKWSTAGVAIGDSIMVESGGNLITTVGKHVFQGITINADATNAVGSFQSNWTLTKNDANSRTFFGALFEPTFNPGGSNASTTVHVLAVDTVNSALTGLTVNLLHLAFGGTEKFSIDSAGAISFVSDVRQAFSPGANQSGLNVGVISSDPSSLVDADIWYEDTADELKARVDGNTVVLSNGAVQQTGGAATAGVVYTATEQAMIQKAYDCLRTYGMLS